MRSLFSSVLCLAFCALWTSACLEETDESADAEKDGGKWDSGPGPVGGNGGGYGYGGYGASSGSGGGGGGGEPECSLACGSGSCALEGENNSQICKCPAGYVNEENDVTKPCIEDKCTDKKCEAWEICNPADGRCDLADGRCNGDTDCKDPDKPVCDFAVHECAEDKCGSVSCGHEGVCSVDSSKAICNCPDKYCDSNNSCVSMNIPDNAWYGVQYPSALPRPEDPTIMVGDTPATKIYGQIWIEGQTGSGVPQHADWKAQLLYKEAKGATEYPIIPATWKKVDAEFNAEHSGDNNHEYMVDFPTDKAGDFIYIFRFSLDNGNTWLYGDAGDGGTNGPHPVTSTSNHPGTIHIEGIPEELFTLDDSLVRTENSYSFDLQYHGSAAIDFAQSIITLNGVPVENASEYYNAETKTFTISKTDLAPNKYSWLFRLVDENGNKIEPFFVPIWIGEGVDFADFGWRDAFVYQIMTDRFLDGDSNNNVSSSEFPHVNRETEQWLGGDFRGIINKLDDDYFTKMGVNTIWISSPVVNPHHESKGGTVAPQQDNDYFTSYHAYHPLATGYNFDNNYGFENEGVDSAFGTVAELRELVDKAHEKGIRVIADFVANHVYSESPLYQAHKNDGWFYAQNPCAPDHWDDHRIDCWFTPYMPDFNYNNADARKAVIDHAIWLIQNFNLDGFRADALKHMDDIFTKELRKAVKKKIETTVKNHDMPDEAEVFYMVGESLGGWARYHTRADMVQGQVNEDFFYKAKDIILKGNSYNSLAHDVTESWDRTYLTSQPTNGGSGGFPGAVMGNFFGNHDQNRALTECNGNYTLLKHAQTFLLTSPINIPLLFQGDDIGMIGWEESGFDGGRRAVMKFDGLSSSEKDALQHIQQLGTFRKSHPALRYGSRQTCGSSDDAWVYKLTYEGKTVVVGINKGSSSFNATCSGVSGSFTSYDGSTVNVSNGSVTVPAGGSLVIGD